MIRILFATAAVLFSCVAAADGASTLAATMDVYVFPTEGQDSSVQSQDEAACYEWAVGQSGTDPFDLQKQAQAQQQQAQAAMEEVDGASRGAGARGALGGAAAGALIGEITDNDTGDSAAIGAAVGGIAARRRGKAAEAQATDQIEQQAAAAQQATAEQIDNFKKAFSVCLEAKDYMVKY